MEKRTVLLLTELPRKETEKIVSPYLKDCEHINLFIRSGPLSSTASFKKVAADRARSVILLAPKDDYYEADADVVMSVIALKPLLRGTNTGVVAEVSKGSTGSLLRGMAEVRVSAVENLSAKLFVQCSRQPGLVDVYCKLLDHTGEEEQWVGGISSARCRGRKGHCAAHELTFKSTQKSTRGQGVGQGAVDTVEDQGRVRIVGGALRRTLPPSLSPCLPHSPLASSPIAYRLSFLPCLFNPPALYLTSSSFPLTHLPASPHPSHPSCSCPHALPFPASPLPLPSPPFSPSPRLPPDEVINVRSFPSLAGLPYGLVRRGFPDAVCCGIVRDGKVQFHPKDTDPMQRTDKLMLIALKHTHRHPPPALMMQAAQIRRKQESSRLGREGRGGGSSEAMVRVHRDSALKTRDAGQFKPNEPAARAERMVMLGWRTGVPDMIREFDDYVGAGSELVILAEESLEEREQQLARMLRTPLRNLTVVHKVGNPMSRTDLTDAILDPGSVFHPFVSAGGDMFFDNVPFSIIVVSDRSWHHGERTKPDKQSLYSLLLAESVCRANKIKVQSLNAELEDNRLGREVVGSHPSLTYIGTSDLMGLVTSQVTEHAELNAIWTELLNSWGDEIYVKDASLYVSPGESPTFNELAERAVQRGEVAIGYRRGNTTVINPCPKDVPLEFGPEDSLVLISEYG
ncbi:unnamed protein product [Closterium sp. Yama58-4]|nr:unnamed protein product [Closterium sp. Yama58-4]